MPATNVYPIPDELSFEDAAAFPLVFETAYRMLVTKARLQEGERVLVWGIGGGVATAALAIAKALGARAIVDLVERREARAGARARRGRDVDHATERRRRAREGGDRRRGADVVVEHVGEATWKRTLARGRAHGGRIVVCGATSGPNPPAALHRIWWKQLVDPRLDDGHEGRLRGRLELVDERPRAAGRRRGRSRSPRPAPRTSGSRPASSSARSC